MIVSKMVLNRFSTGISACASLSKARRNSSGVGSSNSRAARNMRAIGRSALCLSLSIAETTFPSR